MGTTDSSDRLELRFPAEPEHVAPARHAVTELARRLGVLDRVVGNIALAVSEAITNAVVHGCSGRDHGEIEVVAHGSADAFTVTVTDDGAGMVPRPDSPGLGLGLPIIAQLTASLDVRSNPAGPGTQLCMTFADAA